jgi:phenylacetate-CoA ligase
MALRTDLAYSEPEARATQLRARLRENLQPILATNAFYRQKLAHVSAQDAASTFEQLPVTTRAELEADQAAQGPYGTNLTFPLSEYVRLHQTSGSSGQPLRWLDTVESWSWVKSCWAAVYAAAGVNARDRLAFAFSFGPFLGFWSAFEAALDASWFCLPAGGMTTAARVQHIVENQATVLCCTPTYALRLAEVARAQNFDIASCSVRCVIVAGEPGGSIPAVRRQIEEAWGARVFDHAGMTETGPWGYECVEAPAGLHVHEAEFIAEVLEPGAARAVGDGQTGELVLTNLGRLGSPLIRYRTGDVVRPRWCKCACGRTTLWLEGGILGRTDDMLLIRGNSVFPSAVEGLVRECSGIAEFRLIVEERSALKDLTIEIEPHSGLDGAALADRLMAMLRDRMHFAPRVVSVECGTLPRFEMKAKRVVRNDRN